ncbi:type I-F CRISPR-associated helicase Cas3f [Marispirochaeta sp.]|uniref:type I-F CRISPR-associated helicase Cas3f n=1 Tax=Marispirochaeta sp. TaxID=2038653 RepID=UPI0029C78CDF|nr:type I-F CRISPR-associated helicase Cas3f [Marispirochaeta sp.]
MMVTFVSECEKKALPKTRRVLDAFSNRIGERTWQTVITEEGLLAVKKLLRKTASKNTAVSCHWMRSRSRSDLLWVVGSKNKFNSQGYVPVNSTSNDTNFQDYLADWHYLPVIQALASMAALLHDWGKANIRFQKKLLKEYKGPAGDALRHEWVSCLLLKALIISTGERSDVSWLTLLKEGVIDERALSKKYLGQLKKLKRPLEDLPPIAKLIVYLILSHHKMPLIKYDKNNGGYSEYIGAPAESFDELFKYVTEEWGYMNESAIDSLNDCLSFHDEALQASSEWIKCLKRWAQKLIDQEQTLLESIENGSIRLLLFHARLSLMLGDHYYSSLNSKDSGSWKKSVSLIANTNKDGTPKQMLDQHLMGVYEQAKRTAQRLPIFERDLPVTDNTAALKHNSPGKYRWQDKAARNVSEWTASHQEKKHGFFAVNMASTGSGKTFANAKVMLALSPNNQDLRYILALGLRTLTLQTGSEYREKIFQNSDGSDLGVLIGSKAISELYEQKSENKETEDKITEKGSESNQPLLEDEDIFYDGIFPEDGLDTVLPDKKSKKLLYAPILACTIDHIMGATETTRGGRYILPALRLMSSDLVIDEVDDFTGSDAIAIGRLVHLAGMLGRKVMISSATIPPSLAEGYFNCYKEGWSLYTKTRDAVPFIGCAWIDEYNTQLDDIDIREHEFSVSQYRQSHTAFVEKRIKGLSKETPKRKATIIDFPGAMAITRSEEQTKKTEYFSTIANTAIQLHQDNKYADTKSGIHVSFGVIRTANIGPCIELTKYLLQYTCPSDIEFRVMAYHSQQVLLLRHEQEKHLDEVLKRKEKPGKKPHALKNEVIRNHLDTLSKSTEKKTDVLFILVATPVEEVGRDHDFDWAIIEPSSYRSIVQLAGRVRRHRDEETKVNNIAILQYNWKTIKNGDKDSVCYFTRPGYEFKGNIQVNGRERPAICKLHDLKQLVNEDIIQKRLDAIPRITNDPPIGFGLAKLEHAVTAHWLIRYDKKGPDSLQGYLSSFWYLTALPQAMNRFRQGSANIRLFRCFDKNDTTFFTVKDENGKAVYTASGDLSNQNEIYRIHETEISCEVQSRLWFYGDYHTLLSEQSEVRELSLTSAALRFGELVIQETYENQEIEYMYNDQLGLYRKQEELYAGSSD